MKSGSSAKAGGPFLFCEFRMESVFEFLCGKGFGKLPPIDRNFGLWAPLSDFSIGKTGLAAIPLRSSRSDCIHSNWVVRECIALIPGAEFFGECGFVGVPTMPVRVYFTLQELNFLL
ncbi:hypothetical protein DLM76_11975 [Leptospira yasudae]|uniref:Uncharacterized protein n=1 Tax=Leptospira yasudae TaxID=2202201 RepID=A0ABX9LXZ9_9LEPT|nr:hypothetical protein DLM77_20185 [Leptospira yasudae]RHX93722.1 hypothetical protein DLM76_11975 [Leptospira yasudae]